MILVRTTRGSSALPFSFGFLRLLALLLTPLFGAQAQSFTPSVLKLHTRSTATDKEGFRFGRGGAVSDTYVLIGEPMDQTTLSNTGGAAHVYNAKTGAFIRTLKANDAADDDRFGYKVALCGTLALIGAPGDDSSKGAAYLFNLITGKQLLKLTAGDGVAGDELGKNVALSGNIALAGAEDVNNSAGAAYVFNATTGAQLHKLTASDGVADSYFGFALALSGNLAVVGADGHDTAYVYDVTTGDELHKLNASDGVAGDGFGYGVALSGNLALVGAPWDDTDHGSAYLFDVRSGTELRKLIASDGAADDQFGYSVALSGNLALVGALDDDHVAADSGSAYLFAAHTGAQIAKWAAQDGAANDYFGHHVVLEGDLALVGATGDDDLGPEAGSVYLYRGLAAPLPLRTLAAVKSFAPGTVDAAFKGFGATSLNSDGESAFSATLTGRGAGAGAAATGLWSDVSGSLNLLARGNLNLGGGVSLTSLGSPLFNRAADAVFTGVRKGTNITAANDAAIFRSNAGALPAVVVTENDSYSSAEGALFGKFLQVVQSHVGGTSGDLGVAFNYKIGPGTVSLANDSGVMVINHNGEVRSAFDENHYEVNGLPAQTYWGQFAPRVAMSGTHLAWSAALETATNTVTPADNGGVFRVHSYSTNEEVVVRKGDGAGGGGTFSTFVGETVSRTGATLFRTMLSGVPATSNEGLFLGTTQVTRKGLEAPGLPGVKFSRFLKFWTADNGQNPAQVVFLAQLSGGTGSSKVTAANDTALCLRDETGALHLLLREGDNVESTDGVKISVISQVDVSPLSGDCVVLASLTGNAAKNQGLFTGRVGHATSNTLPALGLRRPGLRLRKGQSYQSAAGVTTAIKSLSLPNTTDAAGAGGKGGAQVINQTGNVTVSVTFTNGAVELMTSKP